MFFCRLADRSNKFQSLWGIARVSCDVLLQNSSIFLHPNHVKKGGVYSGSCQTVVFEVLFSTKLQKIPDDEMEPCVCLEFVPMANFKTTSEKRLPAL